MPLTQYELSRSYWDFAFENPEKVTPSHAAMFFFAIEHCNRLGWKDKFGLPTSMVLEAIGMKSYNSYKKYFDDLVLWGFIKVYEYSKNQYSSNIIALSSALSKNDKALVKAIVKHASKQSESTGSIDKPITNNLKPITATKEIFIDPKRPQHAPPFEKVNEFFFGQGKTTDDAIAFFNHYEGVHWMKGITAIRAWQGFANTWIANPLPERGRVKVPPPPMYVKTEKDEY
jgi:hypothetical protein